MMNFFPSRDEINNLVNYSIQRFGAEIELEKAWVLHNSNKENISSDVDE